MSAPVLATKLFIPQPRPGAVLRAHLVGRLNEGLRQDRGFARKLTLISAPAGFGKTALAGQWVAGFEQIEPKIRVAWLSLEEGDSNPARFLAYLIAALQTIAADFGAGVLAAVHGTHRMPFSTARLDTRGRPGRPCFGSCGKCRFTLRHRLRGTRW